MALDIGLKIDEGIRRNHRGKSLGHLPARAAIPPEILAHYRALSWCSISVTCSFLGCVKSSGIEPRWAGVVWVRWATVPSAMATGSSAVNPRPRPSRVALSPSCQ